ncbi:MAG: hypothetical protein AAGF11_28515 [Myxococcota bacterium]
MNGRPLAPLLAFSLLCGFTGCATTMGSKRLPATRVDYNAAIAESSETQMLLNIVRLRYRHSPHFLELNTVVTSYSLTHSGGASATANLTDPAGLTPLLSGGTNYGVSVTERPTVTYVPLQGEKFVTRLLQPIPLASLLQVLSTGVRADLLFRACVHRVNGLYAPSTSEVGADPEGFGRFIALLGILQEQHAIAIEFEFDGVNAHPYLRFRPQANGMPWPQAIQLQRSIGVEPGLDTYRFVAGSADRGALRDPGDIVVHGRSLLGTMVYLSQGVRVSPDSAGSMTAAGSALDNPLLRVHVSDTKPKRVYASAEYGGRWFYIEGADAGSQEPFVLLTTLFSLMSTTSRTAAPVLTVPAG